MKMKKNALPHSNFPQQWWGGNSGSCENEMVAYRAPTKNTGKC